MLAPNDRGNSLHGDVKGFDKAVWNIDSDETLIPTGKLRSVVGTPFAPLPRCDLPQHHRVSIFRATITAARREDPAHFILAATAVEALTR